MRPLLPLALLALVACGGAQKPAASESDTASLEPGSAAASEAPAAADPAPAPTPAAPASPPPASARAEAASPPASTHPVPGTAGAIDGKAFSPRLAQVSGPVLKDGRRLVVLHEHADCVTPSDASPGEGSMLLMVPWKDGYKVDLASLVRAKNGGLGEAAFVRAAAGKKNQVSKTFRPTGLLTVVAAPMDKDAVGKMKIDLQSGEYMLTGDLDVKVCGAGR